MNSDVIISVNKVSKKFRRYASVAEGIKEVLHPLRKKYHTEFWALKDVSFEVKRGETVGLIGKNGSGKSTLLQLICGVLQPTLGEVKVNGRVAALLELGAGFSPEFTGRENIYMNGALMGLTKEEIDGRFASIVDFADIGDFIDQPVKTYSSGMYVRLAFSVAINVDPDILVVDEALAVGDIGFQQKCLHHIESLKSQGVTILLVTHDIQMIKNYCERAAFLQHGNLKLLGEPEAVTEEYLKQNFENMQKDLERHSHIAWKEKKGVKNAFGTSQGEFLDYSLWCGDEERESFFQGERLTIKLLARVDEAIRNPNIVIQLRDFRGYPIYGTDTVTAGIAFPKEERNEGVISASFSLEVNLAPGLYSFILGLTDFLSEHNVIVHEKVIGGLNFTILERSKKFHGVVDLKAECKKTSILS